MPSNVVAELTELYTKKVQRIMHYQELAQNYAVTHKIREIIAQLVTEEREHLQTLSSVIIKLLNGENNAELAPQQMKEKKPNLPDYLPPIACSTGAGKINENAAQEEAKTDDISANIKKKKPLVWTFGRRK
ncbi:MAG: hypothetical protein GX893_06760 [Firmicutes bacterium]|mgnify:CR=1 FL=1|nr:hypothetical protein [Bacillota bacterium]